MTKPCKTDWDRIRELEAEVEAWKAAYAKAIRHDDHVIRQVREEVCDAQR